MISRAKHMNFLGNPWVIALCFALPSISQACDWPVSVAQKNITEHMNCENAKTIDSAFNLDGMKAGACLNTKKKIEEFYANYQTKYESYCKNPTTLKQEDVDACQGNGAAACFTSLANGLQTPIDTLTGAAAEIAVAKIQIKKLVGKNLEATKKFAPMDMNAQSALKTFNEGYAEKKSADEVIQSAKIATPSVSEEVAIGGKALKLFAAMNETETKINESKKKLVEYQTELKARAQSLGKTTDEKKDDSGVFGMDTGKMLQTAAGILPALLKKGSGISEKSETPAISAAEKMNLGSVASKTVNSFGSGSSQTKKLASSSTPNNSGGFSPSADEKSSGITKNSEISSSSPNITAVSGGGGASSLGGLNGNPNIVPTEAVAPPNSTTDEALAGIANGSLKYQGGHKGEEPSPFDSLKDLLKSNDSNPDPNNTPPENIAMGENSLNASIEISGAEGESLFQRMHSVHERCLKRGCVTFGIGDKL